MLYSVKQLHGYKLRETNGDIGDIREVYFDDRMWGVCYFIVETGVWLFGRKVLISPVAVTGIDAANAVISVNLTQEQVKNSPDINTDEPISRQMEERLHSHYGWPPYWGGSYTLNLGVGYPYGRSFMTPFPDPGHSVSKVEREVEAINDLELHESHLRSSHDVTHYHVAATDGNIGHVDDFIIEDVNWSIRYLMVDAGGWLLNRRILLATEWMQSISWGDRSVFVDVPRDLVASSAAYDPSQPITREYETQLFTHYKRPGYWVTTP